MRLKAGRASFACSSLSSRAASDVRQARSNLRGALFRLIASDASRRCQHLRENTEASRTDDSREGNRPASWYSTSANVVLPRWHEFYVCVFNTIRTDLDVTTSKGSVFIRSAKSRDFDIRIASAKLLGRPFIGARGMFGNMPMHSARDSLGHALLTGSGGDPASLNKFEIAITPCMGARSSC